MDISQLLCDSPESLPNGSTADDTAANVLFQEIGRGSCGTVFQHNNTTAALKVANKEDGELWNEYLMLARVQYGFKNINLSHNLRAPDIAYFVSDGDSEWWDSHETYFPPRLRNMKPQVLYIERILPIPAPIRQRLIDRHCPEDMKANARDDPLNEACLLRVHLGKRRPESGLDQLRSFFLRNFTIYQGEVGEDIPGGQRYDVRNVECLMGQALAAMHWKVRIDADGVKFVLGMDGKSRWHHLVPSQIAALPENISTWPLTQSTPEPMMRLWLFDSNRCKDMPKNGKGVQQAVQVFCHSDSHFPRPSRKADSNNELWHKFVNAYMETANSILKDEESISVKALPGIFIICCTYWITNDENMNSEESKKPLGKAQSAADEVY
ncbi:hypothetical protein AJ80_05331 [Polytolypa hystricis UAMH7299]|uniref:DUF3669 domain-containing protein n=1 Tax=Polytolypa hystricis (strain UAMH7299) TaxID=1447883 RepID=A0A2B7Y3P9_POLH7|nr:hypothetical protein AJ80_05331 [Polytolypa hystricis UAMH7299]